MKQTGQTREEESGKREGKGRKKRGGVVTGAARWATRSHAGLFPRLISITTLHFL